jgi:hypothetical protein
VNNGGSTKTHALSAGSPAINAGVSATDQRGQVRVADGTVDIGAYESAAIPDAGPDAAGPDAAVPDAAVPPYVFANHDR